MYKEIYPQLVEKSRNNEITIISNEILLQLVAKLSIVPSGHHRVIIDSCENDVNKTFDYYFFNMCCFVKAINKSYLAKILNSPGYI